MSKTLIPDDSNTKSYDIKDTKWQRASRSPKVNSKWTPCKAGSKKGEWSQSDPKRILGNENLEAKLVWKVFGKFCGVLDWTTNWAHGPVYMRHRLAILYTVTSALALSKWPANFSNFLKYKAAKPVAGHFHILVRLSLIHPLAHALPHSAYLTAFPLARSGALYARLSANRLVTWLALDQSERSKALGRGWCVCNMIWLFLNERGALWLKGDLG